MGTGTSQQQSVGLSFLQSQLNCYALAIDAADLVLRHSNQREVEERKKEKFEKIECSSDTAFETRNQILRNVEKALRRQAKVKEV